MNTSRGTFSSITSLAATVILFSTLAASPAISCPEVKFDPATGTAMDVNDMRAALEALTQEQQVADASR